MEIKVMKSKKIEIERYDTRPDWDVLSITDGDEVIAIVDCKVFRTFGTLCGGWVQCLHYRYRSSLK